MKSDAQSAPIIREMVEADLATAVELWSKAEGVELCEGDSLEDLRSYLVRNPGMSQVVWVDGELAGAVLGGHDGRRGYIYHLAVAPAHRGKSYGGELVKRILARLRGAGLKRSLILVAADNEGGKAFWKRLGWDPLDGARPMGIDL